jgi:predicted regulator of Ras-like GTPase activity (Roadblock/LC7/MglB family)
VNRLLILVALLAVVLAACGTNQADETDPTVTPEPTAAPTTEAPDDTEEPAATDDDDGDDGTTGSLEELLPDELNGVARSDAADLSAFLAPALQAQGLDAEEIDFAFVTYGTGSDGVIVNAMRVPGIAEDQLEMMARFMSGVEGAEDVNAETETIGGKSVLSMSAPGQEGTVYIYFVDDVAFTIISPDPALAEQLLSQLP